MAAAKVLTVLCAVWAVPLLALPDKPLAYKLTTCVAESGPPNMSAAPLQVCILPAVIYYRIGKEDWHGHFTNCVAKKTTSDATAYGYWVKDVLLCIKQWTILS